MDHKVDITATDSEGETALHDALRNAAADEDVQCSIDY